MSGILDNRLLEFAGQVMQLANELPSTLTTRKIMDQLLRSATSIGANYEEASAAESRADFIHKLHISFKESRETCYWLRLLTQFKLVPETRILPILQESLEIRAMLTRALITAKNGKNRS